MSTKEQGSRFNQGHVLKYKSMTIYDNLWQLMTVYNVIVYEGLWQVMTASSLWQLIIAYDCLWQLLTAYENLWQLKTT